MRPIHVCALALAPMLVAGCESAGRARGEGAEVLGTIDGPALEGDPALQAKVSILEPRTRADGASRSAELRLRSDTDEHLELAIAVRWRDAAGNPLDDAPVRWIRLSLPPRTTTAPLIAAAGSARAESWVLHAVRADALRVNAP